MINLPDISNYLLDPGSEKGICYRFTKKPTSEGHRYFFINMYRNDLLKFYTILSFLSLERDERIWVVNFLIKGMEKFFQEKDSGKIESRMYYFSCSILVVFSQILLKNLKKTEFDFLISHIENKQFLIHSLKICGDVSYFANQLKTNYQALVTISGLAENTLRECALTRLADQLKKHIETALKKSFFFHGVKQIFIDQDWQGNIGHLNILPYYAGESVRLGKKISIRSLDKGNIANPFYLSFIAEHFSLDFHQYAPDKAFSPRNTGSTFFEGEAGAFKNFDFEREFDDAGAILPSPRNAWKFRNYIIKELGWEPCSRIVTLNVRDRKVSRSSTNLARSASISTYVPGIEALVRRGYRIIRVGGPDQEELPTINGFFDYARSNFKSDRNDIFLLATADFHIGSSSGLSLVPLAFGRPCLMLNWFPRRDRPWGSRTVTRYKHLVWIESNQVVKDRNLLNRFGGVTSLSVLDVFGLKLVDNSSEEIERAIIDFSYNYEANS